MRFWERIKQAGRSFMAGRYGVDQLSNTLVWGGLVLNVIGSIFAVAISPLLGMVACGFAFFRIFSRDREKRSAENTRYLNWRNRLVKKWKQARTRFANRKQYKYFKCPGCKAWLKLPKGSGVVTVTCSRCQNHFTEKA